MNLINHHQQKEVKLFPMHLLLIELEMEKVVKEHQDSSMTNRKTNNSYKMTMENVLVMTSLLTCKQEDREVHLDCEMNNK